MNLQLDEMETHFSIDATDRHTCHIATDDPVWVRRMLKWFKPVERRGDWYRFEVKTSLVIRTSALKFGTKALGADVKPMPAFATEQTGKTE